MKDYSGYLILSDIDGTLTNRGGMLSEENRRAILSFMENGGMFALSTGRPPEYLDRFPFRSNAPCITINGTLISAPDGTPLVRLPIEDDPTDVLAYAAENYPGIDHIRAHGITEAAYWQDERKKEDIRNCIRLSEKIHKIVTVCETEEVALTLMHDLMARYGDRYDFNRSWPIGLEMYRHGAGKGACIRHLRAMLPQIHTVIAAGDYENDIEMLAEADIGCAVANALPSVKAVADREIVSCEEHAIAYIIDTLIPSLRYPK